jgi:pantoate--beta-alanine ligase
MQVIKTISQLQEALATYRGKQKIGFIPTMGALHKGHISLVKRSVEDENVSVVSIYVNPSQFNDANDLKRYPRNLEADCELLKTTHCEFVFAPSDNEMYPLPDTRKFNFDSLETVMEGKFRPGHFNGVGQIVSKLFDCVQPDKAYFGLKDFQQLAIIKKLVEDYNYPIEIVPCEIVRENDGLAMSSRNMLLEDEMRLAAPFIHQTLMKIKEMAEKIGPQQLVNFVVSQFQGHKYLSLEYFEVVDNKTLQPINSFEIKAPCTCCIAVFAGKIRLIDNVQLFS